MLSLGHRPRDHQEQETRYNLPSQLEVKVLYYESNMTIKLYSIKLQAILHATVEDNEGYG